ncbi:hypothetical protein I3843_05G146200 [Carya illinoinensis]|nr:hypothetical protein I3843_05G146200 [Carya illinoinensis]
MEAEHGQQRGTRPKQEHDLGPQRRAETGNQQEREQSTSKKKKGTLGRFTQRGIFDFLQNFYFFILSLFFAVLRGEDIWINGGNLSCGTFLFVFIHWVQTAKGLVMDLVV